jgi:hypothetical protein
VSRRFVKNVFIARHCQRQITARFALWRDQELLKSLAYASANFTARFALWRERFKNLAFASV